MKTKNMTTSQLRKSIGPSPLRLGFLLVPLALACFALSPTAQAVSPPPRITISAAPTTANEGGTATFTIRTSRVNRSRFITVNYIMSGTAILDTDYTLTGTLGQVTIPRGASFATVTLTTFTDALSEPNKTATMTLRRGIGYTLPIIKTRKTATVTIADVAPAPFSLIGAFNFSGPYPPVSEVAYIDELGQTLSTGAYAGQVFLFVSPTAMNASAATQLIQTNGGTVIAQIPTAGFYWAQGAQGSEGSFITAVFTNPSVIYAAPNVPLTGAQTSTTPVPLSGATSTAPLTPPSGCSIAQFDHFGDLPVNDVCGLSHGFAVNEILTQNSQCAGIYDITQGGQVVLSAPSDVGFGILRAAEGARITGQNLIVNAS